MNNHHNQEPRTRMNLAMTSICFVWICGILVTNGAQNVLAEEKWEVAAKAAHRRMFPNVHPLPTGKILIFGGNYADSEIFDPVDRSTRIVPMKHVRSSNGSVQFPDGRVAVFGGSGTHGQTPIEIFDPVTETWQTQGMFPDGRYQNVAVLIDSHRALIIGGRLGQSNVRSSCYMYDVLTGEVKQVADFPYVTSYSQAVQTVDGRTLAFAGRSDGPLSYRSAVIHEFDTTRGTWEVFGQMPQQNYYPSLCKLPSGQVLILGGSDREGPLRDEFRKSVEVIDGTTVTKIMDMIETRAGHVAFGFSDTLCLVVGGADNIKGKRKSCEWLNLMQREARFGPELNVGRSFFGGASVTGRDNNDYYVVTGGEPSGEEGSIEVLVSKECDKPTQNLLDAKLFRLVGMAAVTDEGVRITPSTGTAVGRMSSNVPLDGSSFDMSVGLKLSRGTDNGYMDGGAQGADGIALVFSTGIDRTYLGRMGEGLGYDGLPNVVVVEVDSYRNPGNNDRDPDHVALMVPVQGVTSSRHDDKNTVALQPLPFSLVADGSVYTFRVRYDGSRLNVFASSTTTGTELVLSVPNFDIFERLGVTRSTPLYASITSATGKSMQEHTIVRWNLEGCGAITSVEDDQDVYVRSDENIESTLFFDEAHAEIVIGQPLATDVVVYDLTGNVVLRHATSVVGQRIDVSTLPRGFYVATSGTTRLSFVVHD